MRLKKVTFILAIIIFTFSSCQSDDSPSINTTLLQGKWYYSNYCKEQNSLELKSDKTYSKVFSGNRCDNNENNTILEKGTYSLNGDLITFKKISEEIIEEGTVPQVGIPDLTVLLYTRVSHLDEDTMILEYRFKNIQEYSDYTEFTKN